MTREDTIKLIKQDIASRSEKIESLIYFIGNFYQVKISQQGKQRKKTVNYSANLDFTQVFRIGK